jgi:hypothetical protein
MSFVITAPETMAAAATDLAGIGSTLSEAHMAAVSPTVGLVPAAADEVSAGVAHLFSRYAEDFHGLAARATAFHDQFVQHLTAGAGSYAGAEAANVSLLHPLAAGPGSIVSAIIAIVEHFGSYVEDFGFYVVSPYLPPKGGNPLAWLLQQLGNWWNGCPWCFIYG